MADSNSAFSDGTEARDGVQRALTANGFYSKICEENGLKVVSWQSFGAWKEYVDGQIDESQLNTKVRVELEELSSTFGKYVVADKDEESKHFKEEKEKLDRAKQANKIYRLVCAETGMKVSFFQDFSSWSDFVEGKIDETEFYQRARSEVEKMSNKIRSATISN